MHANDGDSSATKLPIQFLVLSEITRPETQWDKNYSCNGVVACIWEEQVVLDETKFEREFSRYPHSTVKE
jgi:hypothetical protein